MEGVNSWAFLLIATELVWIGAALWLAVAAFRVSASWGLLTLFVPFGALAFVCRHWREGGTRFLVCVFSAVACGAIFLTHLELVLPYIQHYPALVAALRATPFAAPVPVAPASQLQNPRTVSGSVNELLLTQRDDLLARQTAYDKHATELNATYGQLKAARDGIKGSSPALAAFNAKAALYQDALKNLALEKTGIDALQQKINAAAALSQAAIHTVANASQGLATETPATRAAMAAAVQRIRIIVNQVPPAVAKPAGAESWNYGFHPGAAKPDFDHTDIVSGREFWPHDYIDMQGNPDVYYRGADCEFNSQTKFFYSNRDLPKKRLSDAEYQELVRLYRFVGKCQRELGVTL